MAPPLEPSGLPKKDWRPRPRSASTTFRLPRRTRRATILCLLVAACIFYSLIDAATRISFSFPTTEQDHVHPGYLPNLFDSLSNIPGAGMKLNQRVLFVAGNLTAASKLVGIACEMAEQKRTSVHFALIGSDNVPIADFRRINGLPAADDYTGCQVTFHDARPWKASKLPLKKRKLASKIALLRLHQFIYPQAVIMDPSLEEKWLMEISQAKCRQMETVLVELPKHATEEVSWLTRLDSSSLSSWNHPTYEIMILADTHLGNLERLLKSIQSASYPTPSHQPTRITVVLPTNAPLSVMTQSFLSTFHFPGETLLNIVRPIAATSSFITFLQSFYPVNPHHSLLLLEPHIELSSLFPHYLLFTTLHYRYSLVQYGASILLGIALEPPTTILDGTKPFPTEKLQTYPFLYQYPTSPAVLYFPQHWSEFHAYISHKLFPSADLGPRSPVSSATEVVLAPSLVDTWRHHLIELSRARGYLLLYPSFSTSLAKAHSENPARGGKTLPERGLMTRVFLDELPKRGLEDWELLPIVDAQGMKSDFEAVAAEAREYKMHITTCPAGTKRRKRFEVGDLFCDKNGRTL